MARAWEAGQRSVPEWGRPLLDADGIPDAAAEFLAASRPEDQDLALRRYEIIRPVLDGKMRACDIKELSVHTVKVLLRKYRAAERDLHCGYCGLIPQIHKRGNRTDRLTPEFNAIMEAVAAEVYEQPGRPTRQTAYTELFQRCDRIGLDLCSYKTYADYLNKREEARRKRKREGRRAEIASRPHLPGKASLLNKNGMGPSHLVHIDHTQLDTFLCLVLGYGRLSKTPLERPWLTLAICAWSHRVLGYYISFDPPSYMSCMMVMRHVVMRNKALCRVVMVDHGREFKSRAFSEFCASQKIDIRFRPKGEPRYGAPVERMFGTTNTQFLYALVGNTQNLRNPRGMSSEVDPRKHAVWTLPEFDARLWDYFFNCYENLPKEALSGMSPRQTFEAGLKDVGSYHPPRVDYTRHLYMMTLPPAKRGDATVTKNNGIQVDNIVYNSKELQPWKGKKVPVRVDPDDAGHVFVPFGGNSGWIECRSKHYPSLQGHSLKEVRLASAEIRAMAGKGGSTPRVRAGKLASLLSDARAHEEVERQRARDEARRKSSQVRVPGGAAPMDPESGKPPLESFDATDSGPSHGDPERSIPTWDDVPPPEEIDS